MELEAVGEMETPYLTKFGVPRQSELASSAVCALVVGSSAPEAKTLRGALPGSRLWVVWGFSKNEARAGTRFSPTVRPPRLGGERRVGVFATRSSFRPNSLALSSLQVITGPAEADGAVRVGVTGADMADGSPVYAVFPYAAKSDCHERAASGWTAEEKWQPLEVAPVPARLMGNVPEEQREGLLEALSLDPRPAYTRESQPDREFWFPYAGTVVFFHVRDGLLSVANIATLPDEDEAEIRETGTLRVVELERLSSLKT